MQEERMNMKHLALDTWKPQLGEPIEQTTLESFFSSICQTYERHQDVIQGLGNQAMASQTSSTICFQPLHSLRCLLHSPAHNDVIQLQHLDELSRVSPMIYTNRLISIRISSLLILVDHFYVLRNSIEEDFRARTEEL